MDLQSLTLRDILALKSLVEDLAEFIIEESKLSLSTGESLEAGSLGELKESASAANLIGNLSEENWMALLKATLPEIQRLVDADDSFPSTVKASDLFKELDDADFIKRGGQPQQRTRTVKAAEELCALLMSPDHHPSLVNLEMKLAEKTPGLNPYSGFWKDYIRKNASEIMLELVRVFDDKLSQAQNMLEETAESSGPSEEFPHDIDPNEVHDV